jgi:hypothetical protein
VSKGVIAATVTCVLAISLAGCASSAATTRHVAPPSDAQSFVDGQMDQTLVSIDRSLKTLLVIERGGEPQRRPAPISDTVAGADAYGYSMPRPPINVPRQPEGARAMAAGRTALNSRTRIDWKGDPRELLRSLSSGIGYSYGEVGPAHSLPSLEIHRSDASSTDVLADVAHAIDGHADIRVITAARRIELSYR